ncbi:nucleoid occlusion protein [Priestia megaterium]|jgi:ParB family chromosome partitioning protein|uniref:nucleoid occlusion protein n=1 Tax=Priestia megaterium TaxID=1404 RepID=UPI000BF81B38|nr:nucleoid occlusion protein [Priestia megaterium]MDH6651731.1 ParB family chromosome partitioning protein [Bacillus sp. PvP124]MDD9795634.1 nucleoid occlusion protein [Priestia megaterium]MDF2056901.1 nucleoid occlusion protein [Priestia megaterium]MDF2063115.1 nucleoid occlusion protein [Priestia megaterium]MED3868464.1 nucleoid occlusion protein [Priestia megaterium]
MKSAFSRFFNLKEKDEDIHVEIETVQDENVEKVLRDEVKQIRVSSIIPNRYQPRTVFNEAKIEELALTIHTHGIIQPIVVRPTEGEEYELIAGERRWRAVQSLGWDTVPAIVKHFNDTETASVALIENLQREELTAVEEALAYAKLIELHNLTQEALAQRLGKGQSTIANKLRLLKLPVEIQEAIKQKLITERHARALIPLKNQEKQLQVLAEIIEKQLNVKQTEDRVVKLLEKQVKKPKAKRKAFSKDTRIAMNTIRQSLTMVSDSGISLNTEEEEFDEYFQFTIKIPKK